MIVENNPMPSKDLPEQIFTEYKSRIYGYINSKGIPFADADDVFGEIMIKVSAYASKYDSGKSSISTWVYMLCRSVVVNYFKARKPQHELNESIPADYSIEARVEIAAELHELASHLAKLPERERKIIVLHFYHDMNYREIAQTLGVSEGNARVICTRAIRKLREQMAAD